MTATFGRTLLAGALALTLAAGAAQARTTFVAGAPMMSEKNIVENAVNSPIHKTLVAAVKQAGLVDTLASSGPFTVFAPTDSAFGKLPKATVSSLMAPKGKKMLTKVLTAHVVPGTVTAKDLMAGIKAGGGKYTLKTVSGDTLVASGVGPVITITDESGGRATVIQGDVMQSNGVIHVVNKVLVPK